MKKIVILTFLLALISVSAYAVKDPVRDAYLRSFQYEQNQNYQDAIRALIPIYNSEPKVYTANLRIGWLHYLSGHYTNSLKHYENASKIAPDAIEPRLAQLLPLLAQERYEEVEQEANKILRADHHNYYASLRLIIALRLQNKLDLAQISVQKMRMFYPSDVTFIEQDALIYEQKKEYDSATALYWDLLTLDPENLTAKRYFGME